MRAVAVDPGALAVAVDLAAAEEQAAAVDLAAAEEQAAAAVLEGPAGPAIAGRPVARNGCVAALTA